MLTTSEIPTRRRGVTSSGRRTFEGIKRMKSAGTFLDGGAMMNHEGRMVGSMILVEFPSRAEVDAWLADDPSGQVWEHVTVHPFRRVQL